MGQQLIKILLALLVFSGCKSLDKKIIQDSYLTKTIADAPVVPFTVVPPSTIMPVRFMLKSEPLVVLPPPPVQQTLLLTWDTVTNASGYEVWADFTPDPWNNGYLMATVSDNFYVVTNNTDKQFFTVNVLYK